MVGILGIFILATGLHQAPVAPSTAQARPDMGAPRAGATPAGASSYVVGPGDVLEVIVLDQEDVSRSTTVQPDGTFTMPLLGALPVAGRTVGEIQKLITELLARDFLVNPSVEVRVREYASQFALVMGEVVNPGQRPLRGNTRLIDLLIESGGFRPTASGEILVQRTDGTFPDGEKVIRFRLGNTAGMTEKDQRNAELVLRNGDVITASPKYYVTVDGEVSRPGRILVENELTLLGVIAESGGLAKFASVKVRIIRKRSDGVDLAGFEPCDGGGADMCRVVDINAVRKGKVQDVVMAANDKVVVSRRRF